MIQSKTIREMHERIVQWIWIKSLVAVNGDPLAEDCFIAFTIETSSPKDWATKVS